MLLLQNLLNIPSSLSCFVGAGLVKYTLNTLNYGNFCIPPRSTSHIPLHGMPCNVFKILCYLVYIRYGVSCVRCPVFCHVICICQRSYSVPFNFSWRRGINISCSFIWLIHNKILNSQSPNLRGWIQNLTG